MIFMFASMFFFIGLLNFILTKNVAKKFIGFQISCCGIILCYIEINSLYVNKSGGFEALLSIFIFELVATIAFIILFYITSQKSVSLDSEDIMLEGDLK